MKEYSGYKINPSGNITLIIETPVPRESQSRVAAKLMELDSTVEQVGFEEKSDSTEMRLQMMGGEFCGNASLSAAAMLAYRNAYGDSIIPIEVSGAEKPLSIVIKKLGDGEYLGTVSMPLPAGIEEVTLDSYTLPIVYFEGISHIISQGQISKEVAESSIQSWCRRLKLDGLGIMNLDGDKLTPYVYVDQTETAVWESSCASGSTAVAAYLSNKASQSETVRLVQPGGTIEVAANYCDGAIREIMLTNNVKIMGKHLICL